MRLKKYQSLILIVAAAISMLLSCKSITPKITQRTDSVYIERLIPVRLPSDSATINALLACDANGRVILSRLRTETTKNAYLTFLLDSIGNLQMETIIAYDTIYIKSDQKHVKEIITEYEYIEKPMSKWDTFILRFGNWMLGGICILIIFVVIRYIMKIKK